jgi:UDP-glucose 4-epimerase
VADPRFDLDINVGGTLNLLAAAVEGDVGRFVFISTGGAIYGEGDGRELPLPEEAECRPDAPYGQAKLAAEGYLWLYRRLHGLSTVALRLGNVYGPRQDPLGEAGVVAIFSRLLLDGGQPKVFGDGLQTRDYIFAGDVVSACIAAAGSDATGAFNVGTGVETSVVELGERMAAIAGREFEPEMAPARLGEVQRISINSARAQSELGWTPGVDLDQGLGLTVDSFRSA